MSRFVSGLKRVEDVFVGALLILITVTIVISVVFRYILRSPLEWSLELTVLAFIWLVMVGAAISLRENDMLRIEFIAVKLPPFPAKVLNGLVNLVILLVLVLLIYAGINQTIASNASKMTTMNLTWGYSYAAVPVGAFLGIVHLLLRWLGLDRAAERKGESSI